MTLRARAVGDGGNANIEAYDEGDQWKSRRGSSRAFSVSSPKAEQANGRDGAKRDGVEHVIKNPDGTIGQRTIYGHDPIPEGLTGP